MYKWNDIVVVGDSFCAARSVPNHWPYRLANLVTGEDPGPKRPVRGHGWGGASWWAVKKQLPFYLKAEPKILVVCHTEPMRLPNDRNKPIGLATAEADNPDTVENTDFALYEAAKQYYRNLFCEDFHLWAQEQWFKELDEIVDSTASLEQVYHLHCFRGKWNKYPFRRGVRFLDNLFHYAEPGDKDYQGNENHNHFDSANNHRLAQQLAELIKNYPGDGHVVSKFNLKEKR